MGNHIEIAGMKVNNSSTETRGIKNGAVAITHRSKGVSDTFARTYSTIPTGGVSNPSIKFRIKIIPKWTGSMPICTATGKSTGTKIVMAAIVSMKQPIINTMTVIMSSIMTLFSVKVSSCSAKKVANWFAVRIHAKIVDVATIIKIEAVVSMVSCDTRIRLLKESVR